MIKDRMRPRSNEPYHLTPTLVRLNSVKYKWVIFRPSTETNLVENEVKYLQNTMITTRTKRQSVFYIWADMFNDISVELMRSDIHSYYLSDIRQKTSEKVKATVYDGPHNVSSIYVKNNNTAGLLSLHNVLDVDKAAFVKNIFEAYSHDKALCANLINKVRFDCNEFLNDDTVDAVSKAKLLSVARQYSTSASADADFDTLLDTHSYFAQFLTPVSEPSPEL